MGLSSATPGFVSFRREAIGGHVSNPANPLPIDFWSPDTNNYAVMDVAANGRLTVSLRGINAMMANSTTRAEAGNWASIGKATDVREILSFTMDPLLA
ncbi:MAG: hypothetical protein FJ077_02280 [Cyanobacteria bacterium K_DeepCast_35m_m2_023]|nr:hypothetical protein [Cyanobacteria bacterium K_DeepCast_35m_m2_023]